MRFNPGLFRLLSLFLFRITTEEEEDNILLILLLLIAVSTTTKIIKNYSDKFVFLLLLLLRKIISCSVMTVELWLTITPLIICMKLLRIRSVSHQLAAGLMKVQSSTLKILFVEMKVKMTGIRTVDLINLSIAIIASPLKEHSIKCFIQKWPWHV